MRGTPIQRVIYRTTISDGCFEWQGAKSNGYGTVTVREGNRVFRKGTHRIVYEALRGPIPDGMVIDHPCRNPSCVRPDHLEAVPQRVNVARGLAAPRTYCIRGHKFTEETIRWRWRNNLRRKACRICDRWHAAKARERRRQECQ